MPHVPHYERKEGQKDDDNSDANASFEAGSVYCGQAHGRACAQGSSSSRGVLRSSCWRVRSMSL